MRKIIFLNKRQRRQVEASITKALVSSDINITLYIIANEVTGHVDGSVVINYILCIWYLFDLLKLSNSEFYQEIEADNFSGFIFILPDPELASSLPKNEVSC